MLAVLVTLRIPAPLGSALRLLNSSLDSDVPLGIAARPYVSLSRLVSHASPPKVPLLRALWLAFDGICGSLKGEGAGCWFPLRNLWRPNMSGQGQNEEPKIL